MFLAYVEKYEADTTFYLMTSITYFEDAEQDDDPKCFFKYTWTGIKKKIIEEVKKM